MKTLKRMTHVVYKMADLVGDKQGRTLEVSDALNLLDEVSEGYRAQQGKNPCPTYIVVNTDEPYIDEILEVLKKHGCWDGWND